jgi:iron complex transport system substrate-binding protein
MRVPALFTACLLGLAAVAAAASVAQPPLRIVSLAPNVTELLYAAGAGGQVVGASEYSDYPEEARQLPRIGNAFRLDYERIVSLHPDFAVTWESGTPAASVARLEALGVPVVTLRVSSFDDIAVALLRLGQLAGTSARAEAAAAALRQELTGLQQQYSGRTPVRVFVQLDDEPLFTVTGRHLISEMVRLCGGRNVFDTLPGMAPAVDLESVIGADPEVILYAGTDRDPAGRWRRWHGLAAVRFGGVRRVSADLVSRATPRALAGAREVCSVIETVRETRNRIGH